MEDGRNVSAGGARMQDEKGKTTSKYKECIKCHGAGFFDKPVGVMVCMYREEKLIYVPSGDSVVDALKSMIYTYP